MLVMVLRRCSVLGRQGDFAAATSAVEDAVSRIFVARLEFKRELAPLPVHDSRHVGRVTVLCHLISPSYRRACGRVKPSPWVLLRFLLVIRELAQKATWSRRLCYDLVEQYALNPNHIYPPPSRPFWMDMKAAFELRDVIAE
jgi:hypothetical protein